MKVVSKIWKVIKSDIGWLSIRSNRKRVYQVLTVLGPVAVAVGFFTPDQVQHWLDIASLLLLSIGGTNLARKNS